MKSSILVVVLSLAPFAVSADPVSQRFVEEYLLDMAEEAGFEVDRDNTSISLSSDQITTLRSLSVDLPEDLRVVITEKKAFDFAQKVISRSGRNE